MNKKKESKVVPNVRFKGFTDVWKQRKVRDVTDRYDNLRIPVAANLRVSGTTPYYGANGIQDYVDGYTHDGEFILVAEDGANDLKNYPVRCVQGRIWVNNHAHVLQGKYDSADNKFLACAISQADIESLLVGGGRAKLNAENLMDMNLLLPNKAEQMRIGKYLAQLDHLITLHQQKITLLTKLKKAMLEKMFPKKGTVIPEFRFNGFANAWEQRKLGEVVDFIGTGKSHYHLKEIGKYEVLGSTGIIGYDDTYDYEGSFLLTARVGANAGTIYRYSGKVKITDNTVFLKATQLDFFYSLLEKFDLRRLSFGSGQPLIKSSELKQLKISIPTNIEEQQKIGTYFSNADSLIALHQRKLDMLKKLKSACLSEMFI